MVKVINKKGKVLMVASSLEKAYNGLRKGSYKVGSYLLIDENGKEYSFGKWVCYRKSR